MSSASSGLQATLAGSPLRAAARNRTYRRRARADGALEATSAPCARPRSTNIGIERELERDVRRMHVERVERRPLRGVPGDVHRAEAAAGEPQEHRDGVVEALGACAGEREQAAAGRRLHRLHRPRQRAICRSTSWLASSKRMPPLARGSANHPVPLGDGLTQRCVVEVAARGLGRRRSCG